MDHTLRRYQRAFESEPYDIDVAQRYIRLLERAVSGGDIKYIESPHERDYHVMRYRPIPGEFLRRQLDALREHVNYYAVEYGAFGEPDENSMIIPVSEIISALGYITKGQWPNRKRVKTNINIVKVARRAQQVGYKYIVMTIDPEIHISENYRRTLEGRGLAGSLKEMRKEAKELKIFLETWRPEHPPVFYSDDEIRQTPLYRFLILPKERTIGHNPIRALERTREMMEEMWEING